MEEQHKYLVTTDAANGSIVKVELLGTAGELTEMPISTLGRIPDAQPEAIDINIFVHGAEDGAIRLGEPVVHFVDGRRSAFPINPTTPSPPIGLRRPESMSSEEVPSEEMPDA